MTEFVQVCGTCGLHIDGRSHNHARQRKTYDCSLCQKRHRVGDECPTVAAVEPMPQFTEEHYVYRPDPEQDAKIRELTRKLQTSMWLVRNGLTSPEIVRKMGVAMDSDEIQRAITDIKRTYAVPPAVTGAKVPDVDHEKERLQKQLYQTQMEAKKAWDALKHAETVQTTMAGYNPPPTTPMPAVHDWKHPTLGVESIGPQVPPKIGAQWLFKDEPGPFDNLARFISGAATAALIVAVIAVTFVGGYFVATDTRNAPQAPEPTIDFHAAGGGEW